MTKTSQGMKGQIKTAGLKLIAGFVAGLGMISAASGQSSFHDLEVTGELEVGNSGTTGNISVTGHTGNSALPGLKITGDGGVVFFGTSGTGPLPATGSSPRFMWYPGKAALRSGRVLGSQWDDASIGFASVAFNAALASGTNSAGFGMARATGTLSFAVGNNTEASGNASFAAGSESSATGGNSFVSGFLAFATGSDSVAFGGSSASAPRAAAFNRAYATGTSAFASGYMTTASGLFSLSGGEQSIASGAVASAFGSKTTASSAYSFVIGRNNRVEGNSTTWVDTDPLFVIGNGTGVVSDPADVKNRNALTVLKNGKMTLFGASGTTPVIVLDPTTAQISVAGQTILAPNSSGNVGIGTGTSSPEYGLTVAKNTAGTMNFIDISGNNTSGDGGSGIILSDNNTGKWTIFQRNQGPANALHLATGEGGAVENAKMSLLQNGNVGIGTTLPGSKLEIRGPSSSPNNALFVTTGSWSPTIAGSAVRIGTGATSGNTYGVIDVLQTGGLSGSGNLALSPLGGNVGIGTTAPVARLHVNGVGAFGELVTGSNSDRTFNVVGSNAVLSVKRIHASYGAGVEMKNRTTADGADNVSWMMANSVPSEGFALTNRKPTDKTKLIVTGTGSNTFAVGDNVDTTTLAGASMVVELGSGEVGIGTTTPTAKLDVKGSVRFERQGDILMGEFGNPE